jgi:hypothetical protein
VDGTGSGSVQCRVEGWTELAQDLSSVGLRGGRNWLRICPVSGFGISGVHLSGSGPVSVAD